jgi:hypothetical protein
MLIFIVQSYGLSDIKNRLQLLWEQYCFRSGIVLLNMRNDPIID